MWRCVDNTVEENSNIVFLIHFTSCYQQGHASSKTAPTNYSAINWRCSLRLTCIMTVKLLLLMTFVDGCPLMHTGGINENFVANFESPLFCTDIIQRWKHWSSWSIHICHAWASIGFHKPCVKQYQKCETALRTLRCPTWKISWRIFVDIPHILVKLQWNRQDTAFSFV